MTEVARLVVAVDADVSRLRAALGVATADVVRFGTNAAGQNYVVTKSTGAMAGAYATAGVAVAALATSAIKAALEYEEAFTRIDAISNATTEEIAVMKDTVMGLAGETAQAPVELADAMFFLASAGLDSTQALEALDMSARASAVGLGSTTDIAKITANALNAYAESGLTAAQVTDTLVAAVREGSAEPEEFAAALGRILPIASQAGISFDQVTASLAGLSNIGLDVNEGVTAMRGVMTALYAPTAQSTEALKQMGLTSEDVRASLAEEGLIGTLRMLESAAGGNIDVMKALVPNVRALTGVFGLTVQEAEKVDAIFGSVKDSAGDLGEAFATTAESDSFKMQKALNDLTILLLKLGQAILPAIMSIVEAFTPLLDILDVLSPAVERLGWAFSKIISPLKTVIELLTWLQSLGKSTTTVLAEEAVAAGVFEDALNQTILSTTDAAVASGLYKDELAEILGIMPSVGEATRTVGYQFGLFSDIAEVVRGKVEGLRDKLLTLRDQAIAAGIAAGYLPAAFGEVAPAAVEAGQAIHRFGGLSKKAMADLKEGLLSAIPAVIGTVTTFKEYFYLSPGELVKITASWARIGKTIARDIKTIGESDLKPAVKAQILALPPEMRNAWVTGNKQQRAAIIGSLTKTYNFQSELGKTVNQFIRAGVEADSGFAAGIKGNAGVVYSAVHALASGMITELKQTLQSASPSRVTAREGRNFILGIIQGMETEAPHLTESLTSIVSLIEENIGEGMSKAWLRAAKALEAQSSEIERHLTSLLQRVKTFRDEIGSAFDVDLTGGLMGVLSQYESDLAAYNEAIAGGTEATAPTAPELAAYLAAQVAQMQAFGAALQQLAAAGLSQANLAEIAGQGAEALPLAQALLANPELIAQLNQAQAAIAQAQAQATRALVDQYFGPELERAAAKVERFRERLEDFIQALHTEAVAEGINGLIRALDNLGERLGGGGGEEEVSARTASVPGASRVRGGGGEPTVVVNVNGWVGNDQQIAERVRQELLRTQRWNLNSTGIKE